MEIHQKQQRNFKNIENKINGMWDKAWVRPFESLWSILNTYKAVNVIDKHPTMMSAIGANIKATVSREYLLPCGIFCNISSTKNDINGIISNLTPKWYLNQLTAFSKKDISAFISDKIMYCPVCMQNGYHSVLHQLKGMKKCPFHPSISLMSYLKQRYVFGQQSQYEYERTNITRASAFIGKEFRYKNIDFEDISVFPLPIDWSEMPEISIFFKANGIRTDFDYIRLIGSDINDKNIIPDVGTFLLKEHIQSPNIILYNRKVADQLALQKINKRATDCGLVLKVSNYTYSMHFTYIFLQIYIAELLRSYTFDNIDYRCYQIERGRFIRSNDDLGVKLLFLLFLVGSDKIKDCLGVIRDNHELFIKNGINFQYIPSEICIYGLDMTNLSIAAQYYILDEYVQINWKKFKDYIITVGGMEKPLNHKDLILHPIHLIYTEQNEVIKIYRY